MNLCMSSSFAALILSCLWLYPDHCSAVDTFVESSEPINFNSLASVRTFDEGLQRSFLDCLSQCSMRDGAAARFTISSGQCEVFAIEDQSNLSLPTSNNVERLIAPPTGEKLWLTTDFEQQLQTRSFNWTVVLQNTSTGQSGSIQKLQIVLTGCYRIEASGAKGGSSYENFNVGGNGAFAAGDFNLTAGTDLSIVVGQRGGDTSQTHAFAGAGGGGGSFVFRSSDNFLYLAAGGGGGAGRYVNGGKGSNLTNGTDSVPDNGRTRIGAGGTNGDSGKTNTTETYWNHGGPGAGWLTEPTSSRRTINCGDWGSGPWGAFNGGSGGQANSGAVGGFGGGGGGGSADGPGGGGGGFSGGGAGYEEHQSGGGGGSACNGRGCISVSGGSVGSEGHGVVRIRLTRVGGCM